MASHLCDAGCVSSQHRDKALGVRPPNDIREQAQEQLNQRGREMVGFITACLAALVADPNTFLGQLDAHWQAPKPQGRPPAESDESLIKQVQP